MNEKLTPHNQSGLNYPADIEYPFDVLPEPGVTYQVVPGVHWLRMPLPFILDHINVWLLEDGFEVAVVDTGIATAPIRDAWKSTLGSLPEGGRLTRQIVTHFHPDHVGLAAWLGAETGASLWMTQGEYMAAQLVSAAIPPFDVASMVDFFRQNGLADSSIQTLEERGNAYRRGVPEIPVRFNRLLDGDVIRGGSV